MNICVQVCGLLLLTLLAVEGCDGPKCQKKNAVFGPGPGRPGSKAIFRSKPQALRRRRPMDTPIKIPYALHGIRKSGARKGGQKDHSLSSNKIRLLRLNYLSEDQRQNFFKKLVKFQQAKEQTTLPPDFLQRVRNVQIPSKEFCEEMTRSLQKDLHMPWWKESCEKFFEKQMKDQDHNKLRYFPTYKHVLDKLQEYRKKERMKG